MLRRLLGPALAVVIIPGAAWTAPSSIPASLKTLDSILASVDLPSSEGMGGVQPLHSAVAAADALLRSLDPNGHSGARADRPAATEGEAETGIVLGRIDGFPVIAGTLPGSPAFETALREGDRLLAIEDHEVIPGDPLADLEARLRGKSDESVTVRVLEAAGRETASVTIKLAKLSSSVFVRQLAGDVGYVQLNQPNPLVLAEYKLRLGKLPAQELTGVVLDLRGARGGRPEDAVSIADPFLDAALLAKVLEGASKERALEDGEAARIKSPLVVIVGPATSGAGEIAAAVLQAQHRAVVLGEDTQGAAPAYRQLQQGGVFLTLPKALIELSTGSMLTGRGVKPDITVETEPVTRKLATHLAGQVMAFARGEKWEPPQEKSETDKELESALDKDRKESGTPPEAAPPKKGTEKDDEEDDPAEKSGEAAPGVETGELAPRDPFHDYPLVKRYDPRLVRAVHLLMAANIFFQQARN